MKRYIRSNSNPSKKYIKSEYFDWEDDNEFDDENDGYEFRDEVERIIKEKYPDADIYDEPSIQGDQGSDIWFITIGNKDISVEFDYNEQLWDIRDNGPIAAAKTYAQQILQEISGKKSKKNSNKRSSIVNTENTSLGQLRDALTVYLKNKADEVQNKLQVIMTDSYTEQVVKQDEIKLYIYCGVFKNDPIEIETIPSEIKMWEDNNYTTWRYAKDTYNFNTLDILNSTKGMKFSDIGEALLRAALTQFQESGKFSWFTDDISIDDLLK